MEEKKQRLEEILPNPVRVSEDTARPRARVMSKLKRLSAGVAGLTTMGCIGFGVVDPMPEPSRCIDVQSKLSAQASFVQDAQLGLVIAVLLAPTGADGEVILSEQDVSSVNGAKVVGTTFDKSNGSLILLLGELQGDSVVLSLRPTCLERRGRFTITLKAPANKAAGVEVPVTVKGE